MTSSEMSSTALKETRRIHYGQRRGPGTARPTSTRAGVATLRPCEPSAAAHAKPQPPPTQDRNRPTANNTRPVRSQGPRRRRTNRNQRRQRNQRGLDPRTRQRTAGVSTSPQARSRPGALPAGAYGPQLTRTRANKRLKNESSLTCRRRASVEATRGDGGGRGELDDRGQRPPGGDRTDRCGEHDGDALLGPISDARLQECV
jgi:hypothetical protein